ncbi:MAG: Dabb family protein [Caldilineaceae bacterium]|nr:Dabb family protein [Caldilineaceae bacterium]
MFIRMVTYHALPGTDAEGWARGIAAEVRGTPGLRHIDFFRSHSDPTQYGSVMHFTTKADLDAYKTTGTYQQIVKSLQESWLDTSKPVSEQVFEILDI